MNILLEIDCVIRILNHCGLVHNVRHNDPSQLHFADPQPYTPLNIQLKDGKALYASMFVRQLRKFCDRKNLIFDTVDADLKKCA